MTTGNPNLKAPETEYEQFVYSVSHDLQEPLRMISSFLKLLESKSQDCLCEDSKKYLELGIENADKMKGMIRALVDISRVHRETSVEVSMDLNEVLDDMRQMYRNEFERLSASLEFNTLPSVKMIPKQLINLFQILLENTFQNKSEQHLVIKIDGFVTDGRLHLQMSDNGRGIKPVYLDKVFDLFKQTDQPSDRIGAGLAMAKEIVRKYGGDIKAKSEFGEGSTFEFSLPIATT